MTRRPKTHRAAMAALWLSALLCQLAPMWTVGVLCLLAPGLLGAFLDRSSGRSRVLAFALWVLSFNGVLHGWAWTYGPEYWLILVLMRSLPWTFLLSVLLLEDRIAGRADPFRRGLVYGLGYAGTQLLALAGPFGFDWDSLAAALAPWPWLIGLLPIFGLCGLAGIWATASYWLLGPSLRLRAAGLGLFSLWLLSSWAVWSGAPNERDRLLEKVGALHTSHSQQDRWDARYRGLLKAEFKSLTTLTRSERLQGSELELVVWPESSWPVLGLLARERDREELTALADLAGSELLVGSIEPQPEGSYNSATVFRPGAGVGPTYRKARLVPFGEYVPLPEPMKDHYLEWRPFPVGHHLSPGPSEESLETSVGRAWVLICFESTVPLLRSGPTPDLLVVMTNDAPLITRWAQRAHLHSAILRAVALRRPLVQASNRGYSALIRSDGTVEALLEPHEDPALLTTGGPIR